MERVIGRSRLRGLGVCLVFGAVFVLSVPARAQSTADVCPIPSGLSGQHATFLKQLMAKEDGDAGMILGALYSEGVSGIIPKDTAKSFACYRWAAERGNPLGQKELGLAYLEGRYVPKDPARAAELLKAPAEQNIQDAQFQLGKLYEQGSGVAEDKVEALKWYLLAAKPRKGNNPVRTGEANYMARQLEATLSQADVATANERAAAFVPALKKNTP